MWCGNAVDASCALQVGATMCRSLIGEQSAQIHPGLARMNKAKDRFRRKPRRRAQPPRLLAESAVVPKRLPVQSIRLSPTERRNPRSLNLDTMSVDDAIELMLAEEAKVAGILLRHRKQ